MIACIFRVAVRLLTGAQSYWSEEGLPDSEKLQIYYANHGSHLDAVLIWSVLPPELRRKTRPVAGKEYWEKNPVRRFLSQKVFHAVLIDRTHCSKNNHPIYQLTEVMKNGDSLIFFPEGTRSGNGEVGKFKSGLHHLMTHFPEAELIPIYLENLNRVLPKGETLPVPLLCSLTFGAPLPLISGESRDAFLSRARVALLDLRRNI